MKKTGEIYKGVSGTYLIESEVLLSRSYDKFIVSFSDTSHLPVSTFKPLQSFQFKKEALAFIEEQEKIYKNSKQFLKNQFESGLITYQEYLNKI
mgnify:CR=1 FL=1|tara:strand:+ start:154 stop:435 length:282 start_codon:yes stop_codon:yes gene_type:complete